MPKSSIVAAIVSPVFALSLAGSALAGPTEVAPGEERGILTLFGKRLCLPSAPAEAVCDRRVGPPPPASAPVAPAPRVVSLLGFDLCLGAVDAATPCDLRLPPLASPTAGERHARN